MITIYTGEEDSGCGDSMNNAFLKCNENFELIEMHLNIRLNHIHWRSLKDNHKAFSDINDNFEKIFKNLKI